MILLVRVKVKKIIWPKPHANEGEISKQIVSCIINNIFNSNCWNIISLSQNIFQSRKSHILLNPGLNRYVSKYESQALFTCKCTFILLTYFYSGSFQTAKKRLLNMFSWLFLSSLTVFYVSIQFPNPTSVCIIYGLFEQLHLQLFCLVLFLFLPLCNQKLAHCDSLPATWWNAPLPQQAVCLQGCW